MINNLSSQLAVKNVAQQSGGPGLSFSDITNAQSEAAAGLHKVIKVCPGSTQVDTLQIPG